MEYVDFKDTEFRKGAIFRGSHFANNADFESSVLGDYVTFEAARFGGIKSRAEGARFNRAIFERGANFDEVRFYSDATFRNCKFEADSSFVATRFYMNLDLEATEIYKLRFQGASFINDTSIILLKDADLDQLYIRWDLIKDHLSQININDDSVYLGLSRNFTKKGLYRDADECYYYYRKLVDKGKFSRIINHFFDGINRSLSLVNWHTFLDFLACVSCGYGINPSRTVMVSMIITFIYVIFYHFIAKKNLP